MKTPTSKEIDAEVKKLKAMKPTVRKTSLFGDNHHDAIDAQIDVLKNRMSEDYAEGCYEDYEDNVRDAVRDAAQWMAGEEVDSTPSESWKSLVR